MRHIFSYEGRAALHQCYAHVWSYLLNKFLQEQRMTPVAVAFHAIWHGLQSCQPPGQRRFDLFHGHIFALHPAAGTFIRTACGAELLEACLHDPDNLPKRWRLWNGLCTAVWQYAQRRGVYAELRKDKLQGLSDNHLQQLAHEDTEEVDDDS